MCGICGVLSYGQPPDPALVTGMLSRLSHRGPDGSGYFRDQRVALGHTRLAIIDTAGGAQPMCNEDGDVWVTFNGEIFNYVELGQQLRALGHQFRTASDTEVIVHAWEQWGADCFSRFNGQWALGIWERRAQRLILSRDRMGVRPLFLARGRDRLLFASEVKALFADPTLRREFDPRGLNEILHYWSAVAPQTVFTGVQALEPGHVAIVEGDSMTKFAYWTPTFPPRGEELGQDLAANAEDLRERIVTATRLRFLRSDVPVGAYLSGGIDSAVTAAAIANFTDAPLHTFSLRFSDAEFDEGNFQALMAARLGTSHQDIVVSPRDIADVFPQVVWHAESPILRAAPAPLFLLSKLVRDSGFKVVVTGEGADEVLAGYDLFREARVRMFWSRDPGSPTRGRAAELLYPWMVRSPSQAPAFARGFFGRNLDPADPAMSHRPRWDSTSALATLLDPAFRERLPGDPSGELLATMPPQARDWDPLSRAQWLEMKTLLAGYILAAQGDRMLMGNSVEGRFPFLDPTVVDFANELPARHKLLGLDEKHILKRAFADLVPPAILRRDKQPYRAPDAASFFAGGVPEWLSEAVSPQSLEAAGVFNPRAVSSLFGKCERTGGARLSNTDNMRVLAVVTTQLVHQQFVVGTGAGWAQGAPPQPLTVIDMVKS